MVGQVQRKDGTRRKVWRVTRDAPFGEYVELGAPVPAAEPPTIANPLAEPREPGWLLSSFELTHGLDVRDEPDTVPAELFDELFSPRKDKH